MRSLVGATARLVWVKAAFLVLGVSIICAFSLAATTAPNLSRPRVCSNQALIDAIKTIDRACNKITCDFATLRELDSRRIDRNALLAAFKNSDLQSVHIFFPSKVVDVKQSFDWRSSKKNQLDTLRYINDPDNSIIFVIGRASVTGDYDLNKTISRERMRSVMNYIENELHVRCHAFHGGWLGKEIQQWSLSDAGFLGIERQDFRNDELVLNQSVHVFVFPCASDLD